MQSADSDPAMNAEFAVVAARAPTSPLRLTELARNLGGAAQMGRALELILA